MRRSVSFAIATVFVASAAESAAAQTSPAAGPSDHAVVFELGAAGDWARGERFHPGGTLAFEITPIEDRLELEIGATAIHAGRTTETSVDLLFKKPWRISSQFEFMLGAGPELVHAGGSGAATYWGASAVADLMFWPRTNVGWYVEPGYEATFHGGTHHALGIAAGLLIGFPQ